MYADGGLGGEVGQQPAVLGEQRAVGARSALDPSEGGAAVLDGHDRGGLAGRDAVNHRAVNHWAVNHWAINHWAINHWAINHGTVGHGISGTAGRFQPHPGPGQVQAAADLAGQVAQQLGRAGNPGQALAEAAE
ncbi:MAG TPA: hypothetical protein VGL33_16115, partial [Streptosporangiaceae bacterium]